MHNPGERMTSSGSSRADHRYPEDQRRPARRAIPSAKRGPRWLREYFWSDATRRVQTALGLLWLLDGGLQLQSFMYSHAFAQQLASGAAGQPGWLHDSILWSARLAGGHLGVWNSLFACTQVLLGLGILYRPLVRPALAASLLWALIVWWFGEGLGMLLMNGAQPLTGAPGAALLYALVALMAWPRERPAGLLGLRGAKTMWAALWLTMAWLWLLAPGSSAGATHDALTTTDSGIGVIHSLQRSLASASQGHGLLIALLLAALSAAIGLAVAVDWRPRAFLAAAIALNVLYWVIPQGLGGVFAGGATDPGAAPLFVLLACAMLPVAAAGPARVPIAQRAWSLAQPIERWAGVYARGLGVSLLCVLLLGAGIAVLLTSVGWHLSGSGSGTGGVDLFPAWLGIGAAAMFALIAVSHLRYLAGTRGQRRSWHACHVLMAAGMAFMYAPTSIDPLGIPDGFWRLTFASAGLMAAVWALGDGRRAPNLMWLLTALDLGAMLYMWSPGSSVATLSWMLTAYFALQAAMWALDAYRRIDGSAPIVDWRLLSPVADARVGAITLARPTTASASLLGELDIGVSMIAMTLGTVYMLAAMQLMG